MTKRTVVGAVVVDDVSRPTRVLAARRSRTLAGSWEFPGGKVEANETPEAALIREIKEEIDVALEILDEIGCGWAISDEFVLRLYLSVIVGGVAAAGDSHDLVWWFGPNELDTVKWLPSDLASLPTVRARLGW